MTPNFLMNFSPRSFAIFPHHLIPERRKLFHRIAPRGVDEPIALRAAKNRAVKNPQPWCDAIFLLAHGAVNVTGAGIHAQNRELGVLFGQSHIEHPQGGGFDEGIAGAAIGHLITNENHIEPEEFDIIEQLRALGEHVAELVILI